MMGEEFSAAYVKLKTENGTATAPTSPNGSATTLDI